FLMLTLLGIGGFFMFRKFLKQIPKEDGNSEMDWQHYFIEQTKHMWSQSELDLLEELVSPVPELFRDVAKQSIGAKIGELVLEQRKTEINQDILIKGYIIGTPKRDHRFLRKKLKKKILMSHLTKNTLHYPKMTTKRTGKFDMKHIKNIRLIKLGVCFYFI